MKLPCLSPRPGEMIHAADFGVDKESLRKLNGFSNRSPSESSKEKKLPRNKPKKSTRLVSKIKFIPHEAVDIPK